MFDNISGYKLWYKIKKKKYKINKHEFLKKTVKELETHLSLYCSPDYSYTCCVQSNLDLERNKIVLPYLWLHNVQDFAQILYFVGGVHIINRNNVFHSFPDQEITCLSCLFVYYCQHAKLNISSYENTNKTQHI
jgi:hypothetical protein